MTASIAVLLTFLAWTLALAVIYVGYRIVLVLSFKAPANSWTRGQPAHQDPAWVIRFHHAHLNCLENLPLYAGVVLAAFMLDQVAVVDGLAWIYMGLRFVQSVIHMISTSALFVFLRANMLVGQWACLCYWLYGLGAVA